MTALQITAAALVALLAVVGLVFLAVVAWGFLAGLLGGRRRRPEDELLDELKRQGKRSRSIHGDTLFPELRDRIQEEGKRW
jgi:hypothetical protein